MKKLPLLIAATLTWLAISTPPSAAIPSDELQRKSKNIVRYLEYNGKNTEGVVLVPIGNRKIFLYSDFNDGKLLVGITRNNPTSEVDWSYHDYVFRNLDVAFGDLPDEKGNYGEIDYVYSAKKNGYMIEPFEHKNDLQKNSAKNLYEKIINLSYESVNVDYYLEKTEEFERIITNYKKLNHK